MASQWSGQYSSTAETGYSPSSPATYQRTNTFSSVNSGPINTPLPVSPNGPPNNDGGVENSPVNEGTVNNQGQVYNEGVGNTGTTNTQDFVNNSPPMEHQGLVSNNPPVNEQYNPGYYAAVTPADASPSTLPEVYIPHDPPKIYPTPVPADTAPKGYPAVMKNEVDHRQDPQVVPARPPVKRYCGMRKKWLIALIIAIILVAVGAIVGGVVGSRKGGSDSDDDEEASNDASTTDGSSTATSTADSSAATSSPLNSLNYPGMSASVTTRLDDHASTLLFYQYNGTARIYYRLASFGSQLGGDQELHLRREPTVSTPIAVTTRMDSVGSLFINLFYIIQDGDERQIVNSVLTWIADTVSVTETSSRVVSSSVAGEIHPRSELSVVFLGDRGNNFRLYFQLDDGSIGELNGEMNWASRTLEAQAVAGSFIVSTLVDGPIISVYYVDKESGNPHVIIYEAGEEWKSPVEIDSSPAGFKPTSHLAACYQKAPDLHRFYYVEPDNGQIHEYQRPSDETSWSDPEISEEWEPADFYIAAIGWDDQVRLYYRRKGKLTESALNGTVWETTSEPWSIPNDS